MEMEMEHLGSSFCNFVVVERGRQLRSFPVKSSRFRLARLLIDSGMEPARGLVKFPRLPDAI